MYLNKKKEKKLNSNQNVSPDDSFAMETCFIHARSPESGHEKKQCPGKQAVETLLAQKKSVVVIKNRDELDKFNFVGGH